MDRKIRRRIHRLQGAGQVTTLDGTLLSAVTYDVDVYQNVIVTSRGDELAGTRSVDIRLRGHRLDLMALVLLGEKVTLHLHDGSTLDMFYSANEFIAAGGIQPPR
jgi:hypothetical protein